jgi:hypothetical protein
VKQTERVGRQKWKCPLEKTNRMESASRPLNQRRTSRRNSDLRRSIARAEEGWTGGGASYSRRDMMRMRRSFNDE